MRKREPPESHKQRLYKLPQVSWSWEATLIVYWGDFSSEGYYLHIRNSYTFNSYWWITCVCLLLPCSNSSRNPLTKFYDLWLWDEYSGGVSGHHLSSTWRASYNSFWLVENCIRCSFKLNTGCPVLFLSNRKNTLFSDVLVCMWIQMFWVSKLLLRQCVNVGPYIF